MVENTVLHYSQALSIILALALGAGMFYWLWRNSTYTSRKAMLTLTRYMPDPVFIVNKQGAIIAYSHAACQLFNYTPEEVLNLTVEQLMPRDFAAQHQRLRTNYMQKNLGQAMDNEVICVNKQGERITGVTRVRTFRLNGEAYAYVSIHDVSQYKYREALLKGLSEQDPLTGLANRRLFAHDLQKEWQRARRDNQPLSLMMIDVDFFKHYNDFYGHPNGDTCLKKVAEILTTTIQRATDCIARYGGEEFVCLMPNISSQDSLRKAESIRAAVESANIVHAKSPISAVVTVSIGVTTMIPQEGLDTELLIAKADAALYRAKAQGRNCVKASNELLTISTQHWTNRNRDKQ